MSDTMLLGVLCMPPEMWDDSALDVTQRHGRYMQAARRIEEDAREIERLREHAVILANTAEAVERKRCANVVSYWLAGYAPTAGTYQARCLAHILDGRPASEGPNGRSRGTR